MDGEWSFDILSAAIGAAVTLLLVGLVVRFRAAIARVWQGIRLGVRRLVARFAAGLEGEYRRAVVGWARKAHALPAVGTLEQVFVPPLLIPPLPAPRTSTGNLPPRTPIPLGVALGGHLRLLIAGPLASGRSTLLAYLAYIHARHEAAAALQSPLERLPLVVRLTDMEWTLPAGGGGDTGTGGRGDVEEGGRGDAEEGGRGDAEEGGRGDAEKGGRGEAEKKEPDDVTRLVQAATRAVGATAGSGGALRRHLRAGSALVLVDGWDELNPQQQELATAWLARLVEALPNNLWMVVVGPRGFAPLAALGFAPLRLKEWARPQVEALLARFAERLSPAQGGAAQPSREVTETLLRALERGASPLELSLRAWLLLTQGQVPERRLDLFLQTVERQAGRVTGEADGLSSVIRAVLGRLALALQQEGRTLVTRAEVEAALEDALPPAGERPARAAAQAQQIVIGGKGCLIEREMDRYAFVHPLWQAAAAARQLVALPTAAVLERLEDPRWAAVFEFYAEIGDMEPFLKAWLTRPDDLWRSRLCTAARWAAVAPPEAPWRRGVMALLARAFLDPALPDPVRERLTTAIACSGDPGVPYFLRQALQHPRETVRAAAVRALGLLRRTADVGTLVEAIDDPDALVQEAAARALGAGGGPAALRRLTQALVLGDETQRACAAVGLALMGEEGWEALRKAIQNDDFLTRRAAVYGLGEIEQPWARELLSRLTREDGEWIVRSAASSVLAEIEAARPSPVSPPPVAHEMGWLINWAAEREEVVGVGEAAFVHLLQALQQGDAPIRQAAAQALGLIGRPEDAAPLRQAMADPDPDVAQVALEALEELAHRHGLMVQ